MEMEAELKELKREFNVFKTEVKHDYDTIMHEVKQSRQDSKNVTMIVTEVKKDFDLIRAFLLPNKATASIGIFKKVEDDHTWIMEAQTTIKVLKWVVGGLIGAIGYILNHLWNV
jgi:hypothetical protein